MASVNFNRLIKDISEDKILIPVIRAALSDPDFKAFDVRVDGWEPRPYDGWFHPSTHATWNVRQLWLYLTPDLGRTRPTTSPRRSRCRCSTGIIGAEGTPTAGSAASSCSSTRR